MLGLKIQLQFCFPESPDVSLNKVEEKKIIDQFPKGPGAKYLNVV